MSICYGLCATRLDQKRKQTGKFIQKIFFFKQKTAYEIMPSLVGSEMCIRDRDRPSAEPAHAHRDRRRTRPDDCLLYTSDAADDLLCVDLGGRRIIKKKKI